MIFIKFSDIEFVVSSYKRLGITLHGGAYDMVRGGQWFYK